jgi:hypothetical protein
LAIGWSARRLARPHPRRAEEVPVSDIETRGARAVLLRMRYVLGSLAAGFLVSAPAQWALRGVDWGALLHAVAFGVVFLVAMGLAVPFTQVDWSRVTLPQFKRFELSVSFYAMLLAAALLPLAWFVDALTENRPGFWLVFVLMAFAWGQNKAYSFIFREFYENPPAPSGGGK